jgi:hypothetical protein
MMLEITLYVLDESGLSCPAPGSAAVTVAVGQPELARAGHGLRVRAGPRRRVSCCLLLAL